MATIEYTLERTRRKSIGIIVNTDATVVVRAPLRTPSWVIKDFVESKAEWILEKQALMRRRNIDRENVVKLSDRQLKALRKKAGEYIPGLVEEYADLLGVSYNGISFRFQKTRWGSCSSKKNLNFNCLLMLTEEPVIRYVVVHEVCHLLEMNHSKRFWSLVESLMPDYKIYRKWLKANGNRIMSQI